MYDSKSLQINTDFAYRALVGFLSRMNSHVDEELVASVERLVFPRTPGPEAGEVLTFPMIHVDLLDVFDQLLPMAVNGTTVRPAAAVASAKILLLIFF